jgi:hypothetical protein
MTPSTLICCLIKVEMNADETYKPCNEGESAGRLHLSQPHSVTLAQGSSPSRSASVQGLTDFYSTSPTHLDGLYSLSFHLSGCKWI